MRPSVSAFGRLSGNIGARSGYPAAAQVLDPDGAADRPEWRHRGGEKRPGKDAAGAAPRDRKAEQDPADPMGPPEDELGVLAQAADPNYDERAEHAELGGRVEPHPLEIGHPPEVIAGRNAAGRTG